VAFHPSVFECCGEYGAVVGVRQDSLNVIARSARDEAIQLSCVLHESWIASLRSQ